MHKTTTAVPVWARTDPTGRHKLINPRRALVFSAIVFSLVFFIATARYHFVVNYDDITADLQRVSANGWKPATTFDAYDDEGNFTPLDWAGEESDMEEDDGRVANNHGPTNEAASEAGHATEGKVDHGKETSGSEYLKNDGYNLHASSGMLQPTTNIADSASLAPHNYKLARITHAFSTLLVTKSEASNHSTVDPYFEATLFLAWRFLWSPKTRSARYPFVVFVAPHITENKRQMLRGMGAVVRELEIVPLEPRNGTDINEIPAMMFSKLHLWKQTDFAKIALYDADTAPLTNLDGLFDVVQRQHCKKNRIDEEVDREFADDGACEYTMAVVDDSETDFINSGLLVVEPNLAMYHKLLSHYNETSRYNSSHGEEAYLGWQFEQDGAFPAQFIDRTWNAYFTEDDDAGMLKMVHQKLWVDPIETDWLRSYWYDGWNEMIRFIDSEEFREQRRKDQEMFENVDNKF